MSLAKLLPHAGSVAVLGAGISGLSYAYFLSKLRPDVKITIYETKSNAGGWIHSQNLSSGKDTILLEKGPRTLRGVSDGTLLIIDILKHLSQENQIEVMRHDSIANRKYFLDHDNNLLEVPNNVSTGIKFFSNTLTKGLFKSILSEPFKPVKLKTGEDISVGEFFNRKFGSRHLVDNLASAGLHGIYAGNAYKLSIRSLLPKVVDLTNQHGTIFNSVLRLMVKPKSAKELSPVLKEYEKLISPDADLKQLQLQLKPYPMLRLEKGLQQLPLSLGKYLSKQPNVALKYNSNIRSITFNGDAVVSDDISTYKYDHVRSTINPHSLSKLLGPGLDPSLQRALTSTEYVDVFLVNIYSPRKILVPENGNGFGFLVPMLKHNPEKLLGVIYDSDTEQNVQKLFPDSDSSATEQRGDYHKITLMMGGHMYSERVPSEQDRIEAIKKVLQQYLKVDLKSHNLILRDEGVINDKNISPLSGKDLVISYNLHEQCIPQYHVGYEQNKAAVKKTLAEDFHGKLSVGGMCFGNGVGVPDCVMNSLEGALSLK